MLSGGWGRVVTAVWGLVCEPHYVLLSLQVYLVSFAIFGAPLGIHTQCRRYHVLSELLQTNLLQSLLLELLQSPSLIIFQAITYGNKSMQ